MWKEIDYTLETAHGDRHLTITSTFRPLGEKGFRHAPYYAIREKLSPVSPLNEQELLACFADPGPVGQLPGVVLGDLFISRDHQSFTWTGRGEEFSASDLSCIAQYIKDYDRHSTSRDDIPFDALRTPDDPEPYELLAVTELPGADLAQPSWLLNIRQGTETFVIKISISGSRYAFIYEGEDAGYAIKNAEDWDSYTRFNDDLLDFILGYLDDCNL